MDHGQSLKPETADGARPQVRAICGRDVAFDKEGFLSDFDDWSEELFYFLANECGLVEVSDRHWCLIRFLREFYAANGRTPLNRLISKGTGMSLLELEGLFPDGIKYGARRLAGLPNPKSCG